MVSNGVSTCYKKALIVGLIKKILHEKIVFAVLGTCQDANHIYISTRPLIDFKSKFFVYLFVLFI